MELDEIKQIRVDKLDALKTAGASPYGAKFAGVQSVQDILAGLHGKVTTNFYPI